MTTQVDDFLKQAIEYIYPGRWEERLGGFGATGIMTDGLGIWVAYDDDFITFSAGAACDLVLDEQLCQQVGNINIGSKIGAFYLSRQDNGQWSLIYFVKVSKRWVDPSSEASAHMIADILHNIPPIVHARVKYLEENIGFAKFLKGCTQSVGGRSVAWARVVPRSRAGRGR